MKEWKIGLDGIVEDLCLNVEALERIPSSFFHSLWLPQVEEGDPVEKSRDDSMGYLASFSDSAEMKTFKKDGVVFYFTDLVFLEHMPNSVALAQLGMISNLCGALIRNSAVSSFGMTKGAKVKDCFFTSLVRNCAAEGSLNSKLCSKLSEDFTEEVVACLTVPELAAMVGMSTAHFSRRFSLEARVSPSWFLRELRLASARRMLLEGKSVRPLVEIAIDVGFSDQPHFTRVFKKRFGVTPGCYRKKLTFFHNRA